MDESSVGGNAEGPTPGTIGDGTGGSFSVSPAVVLCPFNCWLPAALGAFHFLQVAAVPVPVVAVELTVAAIESMRAGLGEAS
jgi:hypothetical protein